MLLLRRIEKHMRREGLCPTRLGRLIVNDPNFVLELRRGRTPRAVTVAKVEKWLEEREKPGKAWRCRG